MKEKVLKLTSKRKWFDMILSGEKTEDYREFNDYWKSRLGIRPGTKLAKMTSLMDFPYIEDLIVYLQLGYDCVPRFDYTAIEFYNGGNF